MSSLVFKVDKMFILPDAGTLKAFADVSINDALILRGIRLMSGKKGMFVGLPQEQGKDSKWYDQVVCKSAAVYDDLTRVCMAHYHSQGQEVAANE